jgi:hypothetical protein
VRSSTNARVLAYLARRGEGENVHIPSPTSITGIKQTQTPSPTFCEFTWVNGMRPNRASLVGPGFATAPIASAATPWLPKATVFKLGGNDADASPFIMLCGHCGPEVRLGGSAAFPTGVPIVGVGAALDGVAIAEETPMGKRTTPKAGRSKANALDAQIKISPQNFMICQPWMRKG